MSSENIDGGWYDEQPPKVLGASPAENAINVSQKKITILFDEYIKIENANENVIISPPQIEQAEIKTKGKSIVVELQDSLKENTTYTIDFSDAIKDNNENNPMGNYTYTFSTGENIDTMQVAGYVIDAETLEPISGILVGLYAVQPVDSARLQDSTILQKDTLFTTTPLLRVARTDVTGHFSIKGVKPGEYHIYGLQDMDNDYVFSQKSEMIAFSHDVIVPSMFDDIRQDTIFRDSLFIENIERVHYNHFIPDDIVLRAFKEVQTERHFIKKERLEADRFTLYFDNKGDSLPKIEGLNFNAEDAFVIEGNLRNDTITYWLKDTTLINTDTLDMVITYQMTDTLGMLVNYPDTMQMIAKTSYEKRQKAKEKEYNNWWKQQEKRKKKGEPYDSIMPVAALKLDMQSKQKLNPDKNIAFSFATPIAKIDSSLINLYMMKDSVWYKVRWQLRNKPNTNIRTFEILGEWEEGMEYSLEIDSAAFTDIYGKVTKQEKQGFKVRGNDEFSSLRMNLIGMEGKHIIAQLLGQGEKVVNEVTTDNGVAQFYYIEEGKYYLKIIVDDNRNGLWDTGEYSSDRQPEEVYYYSKPIECLAKKDVKDRWNPKDRILNEQKPAELRSNKGNGKNKTQQRSKNADRAKKFGIELPEELKHPYRSL